MTTTARHSGNPRTRAGWALALVLLVGGCGVDQPVGPGSFGVEADVTPTDAGLSGREDSREREDTPRVDVRGEGDGARDPDAPVGPACPGGLGCPCAIAADCAVGVCLSVGGAPLACVDPCAVVPALPEVCNGVDDDCDGTTDQAADNAFCDDANPCTTDLCAGAAGCKHTWSTAICDDGDPCSTGDLCAKGGCAGVGKLVCSDGNACTTDSCQASVGCLFSANQFPCADGDVCTVGDTCAAGACVPGQPVACVDGNPCTTDACKPVQGCVFTVNAAPCDDLSACTTGDVCKGGTCQPGVPTACDDGNPCTTELCGAGVGCQSAANTLPCVDGDACTFADHCALGVCAPGKALTCTDGNPCTADSCLPAQGCAFLPTSAACDDANPCTVGEACAAGVCQGGTALPCQDGNACTLDSCLPSMGCQFISANLTCDDGNICSTGDNCQANQCTGVPVTCNDANPCTVDICDSQKGCVAIANAAPCNDASLCTTADTCAGGKCTGTPVNCDDKNVCTLDQCSGATGCVHPPIPNGQPCGESGTCLDGTCSAGSSLNPATSCLFIRDHVPGAKSGVYWLDPDGTNPGTPYAVWCDMDTDGGGWLRVDNEWAAKLLTMTNVSPSQGLCQMSTLEWRAWDGFDGAPGYGHLCMSTRPAGNWMTYSTLRFEGIVLTGYTPSKKNTYDLTMDCYGMQHLGAFCAGPNDALTAPYSATAYVSGGQTVGPLNKTVELGKMWGDFQIRAHEEGPQLEGIVWAEGAFLMR